MKLKKPGTTKAIAEQVVTSGVRRASCIGLLKTRIVLSGLRDEDSIAEPCCKEGIAQSLFTAGRRSFRRLARSGGPVIPPPDKYRRGEGAVCRGLGGRAGAGGAVCATLAGSCALWRPHPMDEFARNFAAIEVAAYFLVDLSLLPFRDCPREISQSLASIADGTALVAKPFKTDDRDMASGRLQRPSHDFAPSRKLSIVPSRS